MSRDAWGPDANITRADELRPLAGSLCQSCKLLRALLDRVEADPDTWTDQDVMALHSLATTLMMGVQYLSDKIDQIQHAEQTALHLAAQCQSDTPLPRR